MIYSAEKDQEPRGHTPRGFQLHETEQRAEQRGRPFSFCEAFDIRGCYMGGQTSGTFYRKHENGGMNGED